MSNNGELRMLEWLLLLNLPALTVIVIVLLSGCSLFSEPQQPAQVLTKVVSVPCQDLPAIPAEMGPPRPAGYYSIELERILQDLPATPTGP